MKRQRKTNTILSHLCDESFLKKVKNTETVEWCLLGAGYGRSGEMLVKGYKLHIIRCISWGSNVEHGDYS